MAGGTDKNRIEIIVDGGLLDVQGTAGSPVLFTSAAVNKDKGQWYGIRIVNGDASLQYFTVEYATVGLQFEDSTTRFQTYLVEHGTLRYCNTGFRQTTSGDAVDPLRLTDLHMLRNGTGMDITGSLALDQCESSSNDSTGISGSQGTLTLTSCSVTNNGGGGLNVSTKNVVLLDSEFRRNSGWGVYCYNNGTGRLEMRNCLVRENGAGLYLYNNFSEVILVGNTINDHAGAGIEWQVYNGGQLGTGGISGNTIRSNQVGIRVSGGAPSVLALSGNDIYNNRDFEIQNQSSIAVTANDCYWGEPTITEWTTGQVNLSRIYDLRDNASYGQVLIQNIRGTAALQAPRFTTQPQSLTALPGDTVTLSADASGTTPIALQWYHNSGAVAQATNTDLTLTSLDASKAGNYFVVAVNAIGRATSVVAVVTLILPPAPPVIVQHPVSQTVALGGSVSFAVAATGTGPFAYQWRKNGAPIPGATAATLSISSILVSDVGEYTVTVTNPGGNATSQPATLTLNTSGGNAVTRQITRSGTNFFVTVTVIPPVGTPAYLVEEFIPTNFSVLSISSSGSHEPANGRIVWGAFWDGLTRTLTYTLVAPPEFTGTATLNGAALFFGATATTSGDNTIRVIPTSPTTLGVSQFYEYYMITINGTVGSSYRLEVAGDMAGPWEPLAIVTLTHSPWAAVDWESAGQTNRFYRTVLVE